MRHEDLLVYTMLYYIPEVDLKEEIIKLWNSKEKAGEHLLPEQVVVVMRQWHDVHNLACDKTNPREHKVYSVTGSGGDSLSCSVCGQSGHQRSDCPLKKSGSSIYCKFHPELKTAMEQAPVETQMLLPVVAARPLETSEVAVAVLEAAPVTGAAPGAAAGGLEAALGRGQPLRKEILV